jgi:glycerol-3-phosphate dehydrogenase
MNAETELAKKRVVVIGSGAFGTAMATVAALNNHDVIRLTK